MLYEKAWLHTLRAVHTWNPTCDGVLDQPYDRSIDLNALAPSKDTAMPAHFSVCIQARTDLIHSRIGGYAVNDACPVFGQASLRYLDESGVSGRHAQLCR